MEVIRRNKEIMLNILNVKHITVEKNKPLYESARALDFYKALNTLQKPEENILKKLSSQLPKMKMLDIGIGAGRTTLPFGTLAKEYIGIDYSSAMVDTCRKRFHEFPKPLQFENMDARHLNFPGEYFDFVLFSFNGIDSVSHKDRLLVLSEVRRVLKKGGLFCFSTHNLNSQIEQCSVKVSRHPTVILRSIKKLLEMRLSNDTITWKKMRHALQNPSKNIDYTLVNDGTDNYGLKLYFVTPAGQLQQLKDKKFIDVEIYSLNSGNRIESLSVNDYWLYYLCKK